MAEIRDRLCVCLTPLHVLIARQLAQQQGPFARGLYLTSSDNDKNRHYAAELAANSKASEYLVVPGEDAYAGNRHLAIWRRRRDFRRAMKRLGRFRTVCVPSSLNHYLFALLSAVDFDELETFDDGLINIQKDSLLATRRTDAAAKAFLLAAGVRYWPEKIRATAARHYSIYEVENVSPRAVFLQLAPRTETVAVSGTETVFRLLLGPPPEVGEAVWHAVETAAKQIHPDAYLPHPRDSGRRLSELPRLASPLVAEDYLLGRLQADAGLRVEIFGYQSSALVNLARTPRVTAYEIAVGNATAGLREIMRSAGVITIDFADSPVGIGTARSTDTPPADPSALAFAAGLAVAGSNVMTRESTERA